MRRGKSERGASAVEYGLFAAGVAAAIIVPLQALGLSLGFWMDTCADGGLHQEDMTHDELVACGYAP